MTEKRCAICYNNDGEKDDANDITILKILPCSHNICKKCLFRLFNLNCANNRYKCPIDQCPTYLDPNLYFEGFLPELYEAVCRFCNSKKLSFTTLKEELDSEDVAKRQPSSLSGPAQGPYGGQNIVVCDHCSRVYINKLPSEEQKKVNEMLFDNLADKGEIRPCPHCQVMIYKMSGCHKMQCVACKNPFLWEKIGNFKNESEYKAYVNNGGKSKFIQESEFKLEPNFGKLKDTNTKEEYVCCSTTNVPKNICKKCGGKLGLLSKDEICFKCKAEKKPKI